MTHRRKEIRDAVVTLLGNASVVASGRVYSNRNLAVESDLLPVLNVYTADEGEQVLDVTGASLIRTMPLIVEIRAKAANNATIDDTLDALADSVETAMESDPTLGGLATDITLESTSLAASAEGDYSVGRARLTYRTRFIY